MENEHVTITASSRKWLRSLIFLSIAIVPSVLSLSLLTFLPDDQAVNHSKAVINILMALGICCSLTAATGLAFLSVRNLFARFLIVLALSTGFFVTNSLVTIFGGCAINSPLFAL